MRSTRSQAAFDRAVELLKANPSMPIRAIAAEVGGYTTKGLRVALDEAGIARRKKRCGQAGDPMAAPSWYDGPVGRIAALRQAHGIET